MRIYRRGARGIWWVDFTVPGLPRFNRSTGTAEEDAAREWAAKAHSDQWRQRRLGESPSVTWDAAALAWLEDHHGLRSIEDIKRTLRWLTQRLTGRVLASIDDETVRKLAAERRRQPVNRRSIALAESRLTAVQRRDNPARRCATAPQPHTASPSRATLAP